MQMKNKATIKNEDNIHNANNHKVTPSEMQTQWQVRIKTTTKWHLQNAHRVIIQNKDNNTVTPSKALILSQASNRKVTPAQRRQPQGNWEWDSDIHHNASKITPSQCKQPRSDALAEIQASTKEHTYDAENHKVTFSRRHCRQPQNDNHHSSYNSKVILSQTRQNNTNSDNCTIKDLYKNDVWFSCCGLCFLFVWFF